MDEDWTAAWQPLITAIGTDFGGETEAWGADAVEQSTIRRFLEPLEFDCPLHFDKATAEQYGYRDVLAPVSSLVPHALPPLWQPGQHVFTSAERNAQPTYSPVALSGGPMQALMPPSPGFFATDIELDYLQPVVLGDRLCMRGRKLLSCTPKETSVGRGAFLTLESEIINQRREVVARLRTGMYYYKPFAREHV